MTPALAGRTVVITGASGGIGSACARACAREGARRLVLIARSAVRLRALADELGGAAQVDVTPFDVTDTARLQTTIGTVKAIDVLVNAAGANQPEPFTSVDPDTFDWLWRLNVAATFFAAQAALRRMMADGRPGVIVNISSQMGHVGAPMRTVYCATKHAVEGLSKALALEAAPNGVRVVTIAPTFVRTPMTEAQLDDPEVGSRLLKRIPLGRFADADEVAAAVTFAASDQAAMISGSSILVDGAWTAQ
jgi:NAD(P)-dependent dehydrogenase (short-subunit alcohol dehydrogenase family)